MAGKTNTQLYMEARDYLETKIEKLQEEKLLIENQIENTKKLLEKLPGIYESNRK